ncbi:MAG: ATP-binding protein [FCB group bacterium]|jgi:MinD superfamily P-loop ATPase|nr:ATP-binding protein [FCB group bacterium]
MRIAIASGKGGTGKTTLATNLAFVASKEARRVVYADCDVEEPNGHLFLRPEILETHPVTVPVPRVDELQCIRCGDCVDICQFNALALAGKKILVFPELCHGCGGCVLVCPNFAIEEVPREIGVVETGRAGDVLFVQGRLNVGEAMAPPAIRTVKAAIPPADLVLFDAPPGTACPAMESVRGCDFVILVTEPTPFGLNDLKLAVAAVDALELPHGVVINRAGAEEGEVEHWCACNDIPILARIPDDRRVAVAYSRGQMAAEALPEYFEHFSNLLTRILDEVARLRACRTGRRVTA